MNKTEPIKPQSTVTLGDLLPLLKESGLWYNSQYRGTFAERLWFIAKDKKDGDTLFEMDDLEADVIAAAWAWVNSRPVTATN
jgi:hypothetical protein